MQIYSFHTKFTRKASLKISYVMVSRFHRKPQTKCRNAAYFTINMLVLQDIFIKFATTINKILTL